MMIRGCCWCWPFVFLDLLFVASYYAGRIESVAHGKVSNCLVSPALVACLFFAAVRYILFQSDLKYFGCKRFTQTASR
jgi:hypothetical protein